MARGKKESGETSYTYFRRLLQSKPQWLEEKSNAVIIAKYRSDHGLAEDAVIEKKVLNNLANQKSVLRKELREAQAAKSGAVAVAAPTGRSSNRLEALEEMIDDCLTMAKNQDRELLGNVIGLLRRARNEVVWKLGEK